MEKEKKENSNKLILKRLSKFTKVQTALNWMLDSEQSLNLFNKVVN